MVGTNKLQRTTTPSGVFRQPREDLLQESVSQCLVNQDSLCKVSDFEISIHSKYNLPDLYSVDGKGRAVYWLYKHSLADSESVRISNTKSSRTTADSILLSNESAKNCKVSTKRRKIKKKLNKLRDIFLSSATSDIEIKETYNSYVNLQDFETVDLLLKGNKNLSPDKYENLMKNLELRKTSLEKQHMENYKRIFSDNSKNKVKETESRMYHLEKYLNNIRNHTENLKKTKHKKLRHRRTESKKVPSLVSKSTETDLLTRSGLEYNDLDHILNQMKFFLQSGNINDITETQKSKLEEYLRVFTRESYRTQMKRELCRGSICRRLKDNIKESLRDVIFNTEMNKTSSLIVETDSESEIYGSSNKAKVKRLKESQAQSALKMDQSTASPEVSKVDLEFTSSYHSMYSDFTKDLSEKLLKCEDLKHSQKSKDDIKIDIKEKLLFKHYHLDSDDVLPNCTKSKKPIPKYKSKQNDNEAVKLDRFKNIKNFDVSDTFKSLEMKQKQKPFQYNVKYPLQHSNHNVCLAEPDNISYYGELDQMNSIKSSNLPQPGIEGNINELKQEKLNNEEHKKSISEAFNPTKNASSEEQQDIRRIPSKQSLGLNRKKSSDEEVDKEKIYSLKHVNNTTDIDNYICFKDTVQISSDSGNDFKKVPEIPSFHLNANRKIKSNSFPKSKDIEYGNKKNITNDFDELDSQQKGVKSKERKKREKSKKDENHENHLITQSYNCIENQDIKPLAKSKYIQEDGELVKERAKIDVKQPIESKNDLKTSDGTAKDSDYKLFLNINALNKNNLKITSYTKKIRSTESLLQTDLLKELTGSFRDADAETKSKRATKPMSYITGFAKSAESLRSPRLAITKSDSSSSHVIQINDSLIHLDERNIFKTTESESMETIMKNDMLSRLHKSLVPNECQSTIDCSLNIPIYKQGYEIARITRQSPSCAYTIKKYVQKMNKSTQMFEHVTRNDLYTLQWIHDNLFEININPHTLIVDEKIKEVSEMSDVS